jgi:hypothetical protein
MADSSEWVYKRNKNGTVESIQPLPYTGWKAKLEDWCRKKGLRRFTNFLAAWDERGLRR